MTFRFAIDEGSFDFEGYDANEVAASVRAFLDLIESLSADGHRICYDPDLVAKPLWDGRSFWELFGKDGTPLAIPDMEKAAAQFSSLLPWFETGDPQPTELDLSVANAANETSGTIAWVYSRSGRKIEAAACISAAGKRAAGKYPVQPLNEAPIEVWFVSDPKGVVAYFRDLLSMHAENPDHIARFQSQAFPELDFVDGCLNGIKAMSRPLPQIAPDLVKHLSALSDYGPSLFAGPWQQAPAGFGAHGINISDENGNTKQNSTARRERTIQVNGADLEFWWHTKLEPDRDRIHIHPDRIANGGKIIVGIFCRHLTN